MMPTLVGERGPELVMPRMPNMRIIPNHRMTDELAALSQTAMQSLSGLSGGSRHMAGSLGGNRSPIMITIHNPVVDTPERLQQLESRLRDVAQTVIDDVLEGSIDALTIQGW